MSELRAAMAALDMVVEICKASGWTADMGDTLELFLRRKLNPKDAVAEREARLASLGEEGDLTNELAIQAEHESVETHLAEKISEMQVPPVDGERAGGTDWESTARALATTLERVPLEHGGFPEGHSQALDYHRVPRGSNTSKGNVH